MINRTIKYQTVILQLALILFLSACNKKENNIKDIVTPDNESLYPGQNLPGLIPEAFCSGYCLYRVL
jgi:hypothetical protein